jgi:hypothetical protein
MNTFTPGPGNPPRKKKLKSVNPYNNPSNVGQTTLTPALIKKDSEDGRSRYEKLKEKQKQEVEERAKEAPMSPKARISPMKKGGSIIKGSSLRRQASSKGLRTSKKY